jgi:hypothetical protein
MLRLRDNTAAATRLFADLPLLAKVADEAYTWITRQKPMAIAASK